MSTYLPILMFAALLVLILLGYPVALTLAGTAMLFAAIGAWLEVFYWSDLGFVPSRVFGIVQNGTLVAVPLFIYMGLTLEKSGLAEDLLDAFGRFFHQLRGSLLLAVVLVGAVLGASTGIVGATVVTMGLLSLPTMLSRGYDKRIACGVICASGTLGQIIPPSIVLVLLGDMMSVDVGDLFVAALLPSLLLVGGYLAYVTIRIHLSPSLVSQAPQALAPISARQFLNAISPPLLLVLIVLGSILFGIASPTEAAACGAIGAMIIATSKRRLRLSTLRAIANQTTQLTAMVFLILIGAQFFGVVFRGMAGDELIIQFVDNFLEYRALVLFVILALVFVLGFFLDFLEICFIIVPIVLPVFNQLGYDPLWIAILLALNLQTSFLTPPFGFALFYLKGVAPDAVTTIDIYRGALPFVFLQLGVLLIIALFPSLVLWLPKQIF